MKLLKRALKGHHPWREGKTLQNKAPTHTPSLREEKPRSRLFLGWQPPQIRRKLSSTSQSIHRKYDPVWKTEEVLDQVQTQRTQPGRGDGHHRQTFSQCKQNQQETKLHFLTSCQSYRDIRNTHRYTDTKAAATAVSVGRNATMCYHSSMLHDLLRKDKLKLLMNILGLNHQHISVIMELPSCLFTINAPLPIIHSVHTKVSLLYLFIVAFLCWTFFMFIVFRVWLHNQLFNVFI